MAIAAGTVGGRPPSREIARAQIRSPGRSQGLFREKSGDAPRRPRPSPVSLEPERRFRATVQHSWLTTWPARASTPCPCWGASPRLRELLPGVVMLVEPAVEPAEAEVAVRDEWTPAHVLGKRQSPLVGCSGSAAARREAVFPRTLPAHACCG